MNLLNILQHQVLNKKVDCDAVSHHLSSLAGYCDKALQDQINEVDERTGKMPLHYALELGDVGLVRILLGYGAQTNARDYSGHVPSDYLPQYSCKLEQNISKRSEKLEELMGSISATVCHLTQVAEIATASSVASYEALESPMMVMVGACSESKSTWLREMFADKGETGQAMLVSCPLDVRGRDAYDLLRTPVQYRQGAIGVDWVDIPLLDYASDISSILSLSLSKHLLRRYYKSYMGIAAICSLEVLVNDGLLALSDLMAKAGEFLLERSLGRVPVLLCLPSGYPDKMRSLLYDKLQRLRKYYVLKDDLSQKEIAVYATLCSMFDDIEDASTLRFENIVSQSEVFARAQQLKALPAHDTCAFSEAVDVRLLDIFCQQIKMVFSYEEALISDVNEFKVAAVGIKDSALKESRFKSSMVPPAHESWLVWQKVCARMNGFTVARKHLVDHVKNVVRKIDAYERNFVIRKSKNCWAHSLIEKRACVELLGLLHRVLHAIEPQKSCQKKFPESEVA